METRVVLLSAAVVLGVAATVLGYVAAIKSKGFLSSEDYDGQQHCVYRRNPALGCGVAGALLLLMGAFFATAASTDGSATGHGRDVADERLEATAASVDGPATGHGRDVADEWLQAAWAATFLFLSGAAMKRGSRPDCHGRAYYYGCKELRSCCFFSASIVSALATGFAIAAYVSFPRTDESAPGVEMGQPYPAPPMAEPAPPQHEHNGNGPRQPAGTA